MTKLAARLEACRARIAAHAAQNSSGISAADGATHWMRALKWFAGIVLAALGAAITASLTGQFKTVIPSFADLRCRYDTSKAEIHSSDKLIVLLSRLNNDEDGTETKALISYFRGQQAFELVPLCDCIVIQPNGAQSKAEQAAIREGRETLKKMGGDLLIWGEADKKKGGLNLWFINEAGECEISPKVYKFSEKPDPEFLREFGNGLIGDTVKTVSAGCVSAEKRDIPRILEVASKLTMLANHAPKDWLTFPADYHANYFAGEANGLAYLQSKEENYGERAVEYYKKALTIAEHDSHHLGWAQCIHAIAIVQSVQGMNRSSEATLAESLAQFRRLTERDPVNTDPSFDSDRYDRVITDYAETLRYYFRNATTGEEQITEKHAKVLKSFQTMQGLSPDTKTIIKSVLAEVVKSNSPGNFQ
jgi:hypothetical protein